MPVGNRIPPRLEREILFRNRSACCICEKPNVQIHHIDGDRNNHRLANLAVLCIEHHAQGSTSSLMTKRLSPSLIRRYKSEWEGFLARKRRVAIARRAVTHSEKQWIRFEIKKTIYDLPTVKNKTELDHQVDRLYHWHLFEGHTKQILRTLSFVHWFFSPKQLGEIGSRVYEFFWQFVSPKDVPMDKKDEGEITLAVSLLGDFGAHSVLQEADGKAIRKISDGLLDLLKVSSIYRKRRLALQVIRELKRIKQEALAEYRNSKKVRIVTTPVDKALQEAARIQRKSCNFTVVLRNIWD